MSPVPIITNPEAMLLLALASKSALLAESLEEHPNSPAFPEYMEKVQFIAAAKETRVILTRLDKEFPGMVPVPHDGVQWKDRDSE